MSSGVPRSLDLLVVGGGPAGLATALYAARAGLETSVWEPREGPVDKACGEGLMPGAVAAMTGLGVILDGHRLDGIRYQRGATSVQTDFAAGPGLGVRRTTLHTVLTAAVTDAGVVTQRRTASRVERHGQGALVDGVRARFVVAADGLHSPTRRALGLDVPHRRGPARFGLRRHFRVAPWTSHVEVHWADGCEAYVTPVADDLVGVAVLSSRRASWDTHLAGVPALRERLDGAEPASDVRGAGPLRQEARRRTSGPLLLVGDAAGYVDALTGEGVALALAQARAAVDAVVAEDPARYERDWRRLTRRYRWLTAGLLATTRPAPVRRAVVPAARALRPVFSLAVDALAHPVGP